MHPTAKKCVQWSVALLVLGAALVVFVPRIFVRWTTIPVGASLIGAAVVIQALAPREDRSVD